jgi:hypothetical protein
MNALIEILLLAIEARRKGSLPSDLAAVEEYAVERLREKVGDHRQEWTALAREQLAEHGRPWQ